MTTQISDAAASARETARTAGGKFGTQPATEANLDLESSPVYELKRSAPYYDRDGTTFVRYDSAGFPECVSHVEVRSENGATHLSVMRELDTEQIAPETVADHDSWVGVRAEEVKAALVDYSDEDDAEVGNWSGGTSVDYRTPSPTGTPDPQLISDRVNASTNGMLEGYLRMRLAESAAKDAETGAKVVERIGMDANGEQRLALGRIERLHGSVKQMGYNSLAEVLEVEFTSKQYRDQSVSVHLTPEGKYRRSWIGEFRRGNTTGISLRDIAPRAWPLR